MNERTGVPGVARAIRAVLTTPLAAAVVVAVGVLGLLPAVAHAENTVVSSSPADGSSRDTSPELIVITFAEQLGDANTVALTCEAEQVLLPRPEVGDDGVTLTVELEEPLGRGTCTIRWSVTNSDNEPDGSGLITFSIANDPVATPEGDESAPVDTPAPTTTILLLDTPTDESDEQEVIDFSIAGEGDGPVWLGRLVSTFGIATLFGSLVLIAAAWPEGVEYLVTIRFIRAMWIVALIGTVIFTAAASAAVTQNSFGSGFNPSSWLDLVDAGWSGRAVLARLLLVVLAGWVAFRPDRVIDPATQLAALGIPALAVVTIGFSRTIGDLPVLGVLLGITHAVAMAVWIGGVVLLARVVLSGPGEEDLVHAVRGFGRISTVAIVVTILSGFFQMLRLDGGSLFSSSHGRVVVLKVAVVAVMIFIAISARQFVAQRLARAHEMSVPLADRLRRAFGAEAGFGVVVLALSAWLLALIPPNIDTTPRIPYKVTTNVTVEQADLDVVVRLTDDTVGLIGMEVEVRSPESGLSDLTVIFTAPPNDQNLGAIVQPVPLTGAGVAVRLEEMGLPFTVAGDWQLVIEAVTPAGAVSSTPQIFTVLNADGTPATTEVTLPPTSLVVVTTTEPTDE